MSEVTDFSPGNLDFSLCFIQPNMSHDILCIQVKWVEWQYTALTYFFPNLEPACCFMSVSQCCFLICIQISQEAGKVSGIPIYWRIFQFFVICTVKCFGVINKAEVGNFFFWNFLAFLMIQQMLAHWSLIPLYFLNPPWTSGSFHFTYCWNLTWRILNIILIVSEMSAIVQ